jgi:hypothetical protein
MKFWDIKIQFTTFLFGWLAVLAAIVVFGRLHGWWLSKRKRKETEVSGLGDESVLHIQQRLQGLKDKLEVAKTNRIHLENKVNTIASILSRVAPTSRESHIAPEFRIEDLNLDEYDANDLITVPRKGITEVLGLGFSIEHDPGQKIFKAIFEKDWRESPLMRIKKYDLRRIIDGHNKTLEWNTAISRVAERNTNGIKLEKEGRISEAIELYEENILEDFFATHAYERLRILYRRNGELEKERRILRKYIYLLDIENARSYSNAKEYHPDLSVQIDEFYQNNRTLRNEKTGKIILHQLQVVNLCNRLEKVEMLLSDQP